MFYVVAWFIVLVLLALWSLAAWALHAVAAWTVSNAGTWSGSASSADLAGVADGVAAWLPPEIAQAAGALLSGMASVVDSLLAAAPALAGVLTALTWGLWGLGSVVLVLLGVGLHLLVSLLRRRGAGPGMPLAAG